MAALPACYVASPLGFTQAGRAYYKQAYLPALREVVTVVDPWSLTGPEEFAAAQAQGRERQLALEVGRRNAEAIRGARLLAAYLDGQEPDAGTVAEVGYAAALDIPCFGVRTDMRRAGEAGMAVNLQVEAFIVISGGRISGSLEELVADLRAFRPG